MSCERDTEAVWWYSTSSFNELNFTTQRKNLPEKKRKKHISIKINLGTYVTNTVQYFRGKNLRKFDSEGIIFLIKKGKIA